jgi:hypothetical protein
MVAESSLDRLMLTIAEAPSAWRRSYACANAPGAGAAVCGSSADDARRR